MNESKPRRAIDEPTEAQPSSRRWSFRLIAVLVPSLLGLIAIVFSGFVEIHGVLLPLIKHALQSGYNIICIFFGYGRKPGLLRVDHHIGSLGAKPHTSRSGNPDLSFPAFLVNCVLQFRFNKLAVIVSTRFSFSATIIGTNKNMRDVG